MKRKRLKEFVFDRPSMTIRSFPCNHWIASVTSENYELVFDSWDAAIEGRFSKLRVKIWWYFYKRTIAPRFY